MTQDISEQRRAVWDAVALVSVGAVIVCVSALGLPSHLLHADRAVVGVLHDLAVTEATGVALLVTDLGGTGVVVWVCLLAAVVLCGLRQWAGACALLASVAVTQAVVALIKGVVERPRPEREDALVHAAGYAFPSGHAATAAALYGAVILVAHRGLRGRTRVVVMSAALVLVLAVGVTRVYLGAHYSTDVLAGWLLGAAIALGTWSLTSRASRRPDLTSSST